ncbi:MAG: hypothetical protein EA405_04935 [Rhodospirillales bacterium]|nr:MAG: hypothetical protein EA405_04935 [Rhodospirillales bacterium]
MPKVQFTDDELAEFLSWFERTPNWSRWQRRTGDHGEDVIELHVASPRQQTLKLARSETFGYMVTGFDGWALTVCDSFDEVMSILSRFRPRAITEGGTRQAVPVAG